MTALAVRDDIVRDLDGIWCLYRQGAISVSQRQVMLIRAARRAVLELPARAAVPSPGAPSAHPRGHPSHPPATPFPDLRARPGDAWSWLRLPYGERHRQRIRALTPSEARDALLFISGCSPGLLERALAAAATPLSSAGIPR